MDFKLIKEPDIEDDHPTLRSIAAAFQSLDPYQEDPVLTLFPSKQIDDSSYLQFQYAINVNSGDIEFYLSTTIELPYYEPRRYSYIAKSMDEVKEIFCNYFSNHKLPSMSYWEDETDTDKPIKDVTTELELFKEAFKTVRKNGKDIYKGFGFKHLSDVTQYYVHPNNQSSTGTTSLCQPIGEALVMFLTMLKDIEGFGVSQLGDYFYKENKEVFYLNLLVPEDWHNAGVIDKSIFSYKAYLDMQNLVIAAYDKDKKFIQDDISPLSNLYKLLPAFMVLLAYEMENNEDFASLVHNFIESPAADIFVNIHEDFYQNHKQEEYTLQYCAPPYMHPERFTSYQDAFAIRFKNQQDIAKIQEKAPVQFPSGSFAEEYLSLIPDLPKEFVFQKTLYALSNAMQNGDTLSVLFHGPAGTGKTIACKMVCQAIKLPIMETVNCTENIDEFILGKYIPQGSEFIFQESYVTKAIRFGGAVVFEEINFAKPQYLAFLNSLLDDNGFVRLDNGEVVKRHQNFRFFATMNIGYFGTKDLNQALFNRFNAVVELPALPDDAIRLMLKSRVPICEPYIDKMLSVYHKLKTKIDNEELEIVLSPRNLENWARLAQYEGYVRASEKTILPIAKNDRTLEAAIKGIVFVYKWS